MAAPRGKSRAQTKAEDRIAAVRNAAARRDAARKRPDEVPDVYQEMLSEAAFSSEPDRAEHRPLKKRRVEDEFEHISASSRLPARKKSGEKAHSTTSSIAQPGSDTEDQQLPQQTVKDSGDSEDEDMDWEEVGLHSNETITIPKNTDDNIADVSVEIGPKSTPKKVVAKRKPPTTAEKLLRLAVHEAHVLFLVFHVHVRNSWCNLDAVQSRLRSFLPPQTITLLHPAQNIIQFSRSENFINGLKLAVNLWRVNFRVVESGTRTAQWADSSDEIRQQIASISAEIPSIGKPDFIKHAATLSGSQDVGNQLFCALLRSVGIEARLVFSLQPLPFSTAGAKVGTTKKGRPKIFADTRSDGATSAEEGSATGSASDTGKAFRPPGQRRRIGRPNMAIAGTSRPPPSVTPPKKPKKSPVHILEYPIFWVEAFNEAYQKWVPVDATVTGTINKPAKLEPPASYDQNNMSYVVAFDDHGYARDVTRRYTKAYNAKTRKLRIESTENGERWWRKALKPFRSRMHLDRDQVEDAELAKKEAQEGLPSNVQDFKDHPYYALERHIKRHEVIFPKRPVGKVNAGKSSKNSVENVYRRSDVQLVRSADKWYRVGREIKPGEHPLKHVPARRGLRAQEDPDEEVATTALYAYSQTFLYIPPPVVNGRIPKNVYGNLDVYVPSMVPPGAIHVRHALAGRAAKLLGIDFADAVTGFNFKGRIGEAVKSGVVVASEYEEAVQAVITSFQDVAQQEEDAKRSLESLRLWRRFLTGLRIGVRLGLYENENVSSGKADRVRKELEDTETRQDEAMEAGGFFPDAGEVTVPTATSFRSTAQPRSLLARAQEEAEGQGENDDAEDIHEQAPRLRRQRKAPTEESESENDSEKDAVEIQDQAPRFRRQRKPIAEEIGSEDDSGDDFVPEPSRPAPSRRRSRGKVANPSAADNNVTASAPNSARRSTRLTRSNAKPLEDTTIDSIPEPIEVEVAESGGGFLPDGIDENIDLGGGFIHEEESQNQEDTPQYGGGFIPDGDAIGSEPTPAAFENYDQDEEMQGGGFIPEGPEVVIDEQVVDDPSVRGPSETDKEQLYGVGFIHDNIDEEGDDIQASSSSFEHQQRSPPHSPSASKLGHVTVDSIAPQGKHFGETVGQNPAICSQEEGKLRPLDGYAEVVSEDDRGSLLSHDPDDEDAEPEWLNSD